MKYQFPAPNPDPARPQPDDSPQGEELTEAEVEAIGTVPPIEVN